MDMLDGSALANILGYGKNLAEPRIIMTTPSRMIHTIKLTKERLDRLSSFDDRICEICKKEYAVEDSVSFSNACNDIFHTRCFEEHIWKGGRNPQCPVCKAVVARPSLPNCKRMVRFILELHMIALFAMGVIWIVGKLYYVTVIDNRAVF